MERRSSRLPQGGRSRERSCRLRIAPAMRATTIRPCAPSGRIGGTVGATPVMPLKIAGAATRATTAAGETSARSAGTVAALPDMRDMRAKIAGAVKRTMTARGGAPSGRIDGTVAPVMPAKIAGAAKPATMAVGATSAHEVGAVAHLPAMTMKAAADLAETVPMRAKAHAARGGFGSGEAAPGVPPRERRTAGTPFAAALPSGRSNPPDRARVDSPCLTKSRS